MKKISLFIICLFCIVCSLCFWGCSSKEDDPENNTVPSLQDEEYNAELFRSNDTDISEDLKKLYYGSESIIDVMECDSEGNLYLLSATETGKSIFLSIGQGTENRVMLEDYIGFMCFDEADKVFYTYNQSQGRIEIRDKDFKLEKVLVENFAPFEIKEIAIGDKAVYILSVYENPYSFEDSYFEYTEDDYSDYGEKLFEISKDDGSMTDLQISGLVTMCSRGNDLLYLYVHKDDGYYIEVYDTGKKKIAGSVKSENTGYIFSMAVIDGKMYYVSAYSTGLCSFDIKERKTVSISGSVFTTGQGDFNTIGNILVYLNREKMEVCTLDTENGRITAKDGRIKTSNEESDVIIGAIDPSFIPFDIDEMSDYTELNIGTYVSPSYSDADYNEQLLLKLIAGDSDVDMFILVTTEPYMKKLKDDGVCYPLDSSEIISEHNKAFFNNISSEFKTASGSIYGIPLGMDISVMAAFTDNMENRGLSDDIFDDYFSLLKALKENDIQDDVFIWAQMYGYWLMTNYTTNNSVINYNTKIFKDYFESMWSGWKSGDDSGYSNNPYMGKAVKTMVIDGEERNIGAAFSSKIVDANRTLFHVIDERDVVSNAEIYENATVFPLPLLSKDYKQCMSLGRIIVVNPNGKHLENAIKLLEIISEEQKETGSLGVVYKNLSDYPSGINTETDAFKKIYEINSNAIICDHGIANDIYVNEIREYQNGTIDLETAIKSMQRKEDAYRNE